jgi:N-acyl-D-amino-acid deacylase
MELSTLITNARIVDGTGRPAYPGSLGIEGQRIAAIGDLAGCQGAQNIDARGMVLSPGFIELHTHYDPQLCWDRTASPAAEHGFSSVVVGNCSLSLAPVQKTHRGRITRLYARIEDMPAACFEEAVPYSWETFGEYLAHLRGRLGINVGAAVGHSTLRHYVMGEDAQSRTATPAERASLCALLGEALDQGAFGISMSNDHVHDERDRPIASSFADFGERLALARTVATHGRSYLQCPIYLLDTERRLAQLEELGRLSIESGVTCSALGILENPIAPGQWRAELDLLMKLRDRGARVFAETQVRPMDLTFCLARSWIVAFYMPAWAEIMLRPPQERLPRFADPAQRAMLHEQTAPFAPLMPLITVCNVYSDANQKYLGCSLADIAAAERKTVTDALLDISIGDDLKTEFNWRDVVHANVDTVAELLDHPLINIGGSDAGAHVQQFSGEGDSTYLLETYVRKHRKMTLERAVKRLTSDLATCFGIRERGTLAVGQFADLVLFDPETVAVGEEKRVRDFPAGTSRYVRGSTGFDRVFVNGELLHSRDGYSAARAGCFL